MSHESVQARAIFIDAVENVSPERWQEYLDEACGHDKMLRDKVQRLLDAHGAVGSFMAKPAAAPVATLDQPITEKPITEKPGTSIGPYKLLQQLGEGGMGVVYMAEQKEPMKRRVALKIIKPGMDTRQVIARFEAERQALAMMDHPNIAKVLDAGQTDSGRPYFVMELVNGLPITKYCNDQHLAPKERLELFMSICQAVQHAHQKGIIHRDLKPSNILVALYDGQPVPKVIDFGVAKATAQTLTEKTVFTQLGQIVGTLEYMSPEQAEQNQLDVDTRSDVYSLGVVLYELLTGATPFDRLRLQSVAFDEMLRIIREEEPAKPSTKVSTSQSLPSIAASRRIEPARLSSIIRGELDWIVMKALEKDRSRRYETASRFSDDILHYLNDEAVIACPPSAAYRLRKFVRRNKTPLAISATAALVLITVAVGAVVTAVRFEKLASDNAQLATQKTDLAEDLQEALATSESNLVRAQQQERAAQDNLALATSERQRAEANLQLALETLEQIYLPIARDELSKQAHLTEQDYQYLQKVLPFYEQLTIQKANDPQMQYVKAHAYLRVGNIYRNLRTNPDEKLEPAEDALRQAITLFQQLADESPDDLTHQQKLAQSYSDLGTLLLPRRRPEGLQAFRTAIALYEQVVSESGDAWDYTSRGMCYRKIKSNDEALADFRKAVELEPNNAQIHNMLCGLYANWPDVVLRGEPWAIEHGQKAVELEPDNPHYWANLAYAYRWKGNARAAAQACVKAFDLDANHPGANRTMAELLIAIRDFKEALACAEKAVRGCQNRESADAANAYKTRGRIYLKLGRHDEALADYNQALELAPQIGYLYRGRGDIYADLGQYQRALDEYTTGIKQQPENDTELSVTARAIVQHPDWATQGVAQALIWAQRAIELSPNSDYGWNTLGIAHYRTGNWQECLAALEKSRSLSGDRAVSFDGFFLAMAHWQLDQQDEARQWYEKAVQWMDERMPNDEELLRFRAETEELLGLRLQEPERHEESTRDQPVPTELEPATETT